MGVWTTMVLFTAPPKSLKHFVQQIMYNSEMTYTYMQCEMSSEKKVMKIRPDIII